MERSKTRNMLIVFLAMLMLAVGAFFLCGCGEEQKTIPSIPGTSDEVVQYLKDQLTKTQQQLTDANVLLQQYLKQIEEANKNNSTLTEQNQTLNSTIQSLQESIKSLNAEVQRLTALLEEYGDIANGTFEVCFYNGEDLVKLMLIRKDTKITETVTAEKDGYDFLGWALEGDKNQVVNYQDIEITQATNFYAVFEDKAGLYDISGLKIKTWAELKSEDYIYSNGEDSVSGTIRKGSRGEELSGHLVLPAGFLGSIPDEAFKDCVNLKEITIPENVVSIGSSAFESCSELRHVNFSSLVSKEDVDRLFSAHPDGEFSISGLTSIGKSAFSFCSNLLQISLPHSVREIGDNAFYSCSSLNEVVLPQNLRKLSSGMFISCSNLKELNIPDHVVSIYGSVIQNAGITTLYLNKVETIYENAFTGSKLEYIFIPATVKKICCLDDNALWSPFGDCSNELIIYCESSGPLDGWHKLWNYYDNGKPLTVHYGYTYERFLSEVGK